MSNRHTSPADPACFVNVVPGLEPIASEELTEDFRAAVKRTGRGCVVFRAEQITKTLLRLRCSEDLFLLAWGTDDLTFRAKDLKQIEFWTDKKVNWQHLLRIHHGIRPKPTGKPTYRLVTQMTGKHGYRRIDAQKALAKGLAGKLPQSWRYAEENASVEIWLTIYGRTAVCGVRLSDRTMRHRSYKTEHMPASLRPTVAAAMVRLAQTNTDQTVLDPMCGAGTILAEQHLGPVAGNVKRLRLLGGDLDAEALRTARANLPMAPELPLLRWDARSLPLADACVDRLICNPPFGKKLSKSEKIGLLYRQIIAEFDRVLKPGGNAVLLVSDFSALKRAADNMRWQQKRKLGLRVLGEPAVISVWQKHP